MHLSAVLAILGPATLTRAHPTKRNTSLAPRGLTNLDAFRLPMMANYTSAKESNAPKSNMLPFAPTDPVEVAKQHVKKMNPGVAFRVVDDHYVGSNGVAHVRFKQTMHDIDIDNADYNVNIDKDGNVFSHGGTFYRGETPPKPSIDKRGAANSLSDVIDALSSAVKALGLTLDTAGSVANVAGDALDVLSWVVSGVGGAYTDPKAALVYFITGSGDLKLLWRVETDTGDNWLQSYVDKDTSEVHGVVDWVSDASYEVYPWPAANPDEADRTSVTDPWDVTASEYTWISDGKSHFTTTRGNNGIAQNNPSGGTDYISNHRPDSTDLAFEYDYDPSMSDPTKYVDASITQLFYTANKYHDLLYLLGFNEAAGNFEINNGDKGGKGNDFVVLNAQDGSGKNNANFATPPDGQTPRMRMYIWDVTSPPRDCAFDAGVVIHEYTHGVSTRLTGGPANSNCLSALESGGMGEGWGDFMGAALRLKADDTRDTSYAAGDWVTGNPKGIRKYLYSTSLKTNPLSYSDLDTLDKVHDIGTVWATMLYEVLWNLIDRHGKNDGDTPELDNGVPQDGKYLAMKLVIDAMALQPCNPNFIQARDAILDADKALTGGENACEIWKGFAKRGLGDGASYRWLMGRTTTNTVPDGVC